MTYSLWSRGRLLGHSALDYKRFQPRHRMGTLVPTDMGTRLLPVAAGVSAAGIAYGRALKQSGDDVNSEQSIPEFVDYVSAIDEAAALALELRGSDGAVIATEWIDVRDVAFLLSLVREDEPEPEAEDDAAASWDPDDDVDPFDDEPDDDDLDALAVPEDDAEQPEIKFQLQVMLLDDASVP